MLKNNEEQEKARIEASRRAARGGVNDAPQPDLLFKQKQEQQAKQDAIRKAQEEAVRKEAARVAAIRREMYLNGF